MAIETKPVTEGTSKQIKEEVIAKSEKVSEGDVFSLRFHDPKFEYMWGNTKKEMLEQMKFAKKYEVVNKENSPNLQTIARQADGTHQMGDAILLRRPKEIGEAEKRDMVELARSRRKGPKREFEKEAAEELARHGIRKNLTFDEGR